MNRVMIGFDHRQPVSYATLASSIIARAKKPIAITPLVLETLPITRQGLTPFTFSRFLVPWLCDYKGWALFLDVDIMLRADINELFDLRDARYAVMVSKNQRRFEWASVMLFNCSKCHMLTPEMVEHGSGLHTIDWAPEEQVGELPNEWNYLVGYDDPQMSDIRLAHFTQGVPIFPETEGARFGEEYRRLAQVTFSSAPWHKLMGRSVHAEHVLGGL